MFEVFLAGTASFWFKDLMAADQMGAKPETEASLYAGALATGLIALLPYVNVFILPAYVVGATVAVWHATARRGQTLSLGEGARLGFLSTFLGSMAAVVLVDLIWQFFDYQLWQDQNSQLLLALFRSFAGPVMIDTMRDALAQNEAKVFRWYLLLLQLLANGFFCGIFGALAGLLATKIFRPRPPL